MEKYIYLYKSYIAEFPYVHSNFKFTLMYGLRGLDISESAVTIAYTFR
jgi:hypothetical protein